MYTVHLNLSRAVAGQIILLFFDILPYYFYKENILFIICVCLELNFVVIHGRAVATDTFECVALSPE
jgi:hypothetical protein